MKTQRKYWILALLSAALLTGLGLIELMIRRSTSANGYLFNKSIASAAFIMILLSFTFSAIHHFWGPFKIGLALRRPFGLIGYGLAALHVLFTLIVADPVNPVLRKFAFPTFFVEHWYSIILALCAFGYFTYAFKISIWPGALITDPEKSKLWRKRLRYGYIATLLVFMHATLLKYEGWIEWFSTFQPTLPPLSLIVACLGTAFICIKTLHLVKSKRLF